MSRNRSGGLNQDTSTAGDNTVTGTGKANNITIKSKVGQIVYAGLGDDNVTGGAGDDTIYGDALSDAETNDNFGDGNDNLTGGRGNDTIYGQGGNDNIAGQEGNDDLYGGTGNDKLAGGSGDDSIDGGSGIDTATYDVSVDPTKVSWNATAGHWTVAAGGDEGVDTLAEVEIIKDADAGRIFLVGGGSEFTTAEDAKAYAAGDEVEGDIILIAGEPGWIEYSNGTWEPMFAVIESAAPGRRSGDYVVGSQNGDVVVTIEDGHYVFTPTLGTPVSILIGDPDSPTITRLFVGDITLTVPLAAVDFSPAGFEVVGEGNVVVTVPAEAAQDEAGETLHAQVLVTLSGGKLTFDLPGDDDDVLELEAGSVISLGGGTLEVSDGTLSVVNLANSGVFEGVANVVINSDLVLTVTQLTALVNDPETVFSVTGSGGFSVAVTTLDEAADLAALLAQVEFLPSASGTPAVAIVVAPSSTDGAEIDTALLQQASAIAAAVGEPVSVSLFGGGTIEVPPVESGALLFVGQGFTYETIQEAVDAAADGDTVLVAAGTYTENVTIAKGITLKGAGAGTEVIGTITVQASNITIEDLEVDPPGDKTGNGIYLVGAAPELTTYENVSISDVTVTDANYGIALNMCSVKNMALTDVNLIGNNTGFRTASNAGEFSRPSTGPGVGIDGLVITGGTIADNTGYGLLTNGGSTSPATIQGIIIDGTTFTNNGDNWAGPNDNTPNAGDLGLVSYTGNTLTLRNLTFTSETRGAIYIAGAGQDVDDFVFDNVSVATDADGLFRIIKLSGLTENDQTFAELIEGITVIDGGLSKVLAELSGGAGNDSIVGTAAADLINPSIGDDVLEGGAGNDYLQGGDGTDTARYATSLTASMITAVADAYPWRDGNQSGWQVATGNAEGTDLLTGIEILDCSGAGVFRLVGNGGYADFQAALTAAVSGDTIVLGDGTWSGMNTASGIQNKSLTITGDADGGAIVGSQITHAGSELTALVIDRVAFDAIAPAVGPFAAIFASAAQAPKTVTVTNSTFTDFLAGIGGTEKTTLTATGNTFDMDSATMTEGIGLGAGVNATITGNTFTALDAGDAAIRFYAYGFDGQHQAVIAGNNFATMTGVIDFELGANYATVTEDAIKIDLAQFATGTGLLADDAITFGGVTNASLQSVNAKLGDADGDGADDILLTIGISSSSTLKFSLLNYEYSEGAYYSEPELTELIGASFTSAWDWDL